MNHVLSRQRHGVWEEATLGKNILCGARTKLSEKRRYRPRGNYTALAESPASRLVQRVRVYQGESRGEKVLATGQQEPKGSGPRGHAGGLAWGNTGEHRPGLATLASPKANKRRITTREGSTERQCFFYHKDCVRGEKATVS